MQKDFSKPSREGFPGTPSGAIMAKIKFYLEALSKAVTALENARPATLAEIRESPGARRNLRKELENLRYEIAIYERVLARLEKESPSDCGTRALN